MAWKDRRGSSHTVTKDILFVFGILNIVVDIFQRKPGFIQIYMGDIGEDN